MNRTINQILAGMSLLLFLSLSVSSHASLDSDGDGFSDESEIASGTDPFNAADNIVHRAIDSIADFPSNFGFSVDIDGDTAVVGARSERNAVNVPTGAAYVYSKNAQEWNLQRRLFGSDTDFADGFGSAVALDGDTLLVSAPRHDIATSNPPISVQEAGAAYVFQRANGNWNETQKLVASDFRPGARFGTSVAIHGDTLVIGADGDLNETTGVIGAVYVYERVGASWVERQKLTASDGIIDHGFGTAVAAYGSTIFVGAPEHELSGELFSTNSGAVYVYELDGATWREEQILRTATTHTGARFGAALSLRGVNAVIGAPDQSSSEGRAYAFVHNGANWVEQQLLTPPTPGEGAQFGSSVAFHGQIAAIGAPAQDDGAADTGLVHVFVRTGTSWSILEQIRALDGEPADRFGTAIAVDGQSAIVSSIRSSDIRGKVYAFNNIISQLAVDDDRDGLVNSVEDTLGTQRDNPDSDADGVLDGTEVNLGSDPLTNETQTEHQHLGANDPVDEGWLATGSDAIVVSPVLADQNFDAWQISDESTMLRSTGGYRVDATSADYGWVLSVRVRVSDYFLDPSTQSSASVYQTFTDVTTRYAFNVVGDSTSNPPGQAHIILGDGQTHTISDRSNDYNVIEIIFNPYRSSANVAVNGDVIANSFVGDGFASGIREIFFGSAQSSTRGQARYQLVRFSTFRDDADRDVDGLSEADEVAAGTDPLNADTDEDSYSDSEELQRGSDPLDPNSIPITLTVPIPAWTLVILMLGISAFQRAIRQRVMPSPPQLKRNLNLR